MAAKEQDYSDVLKRIDDDIAGLTATRDYILHVLEARKTAASTDKPKRGRTKKKDRGLAGELGV